MKWADLRSKDEEEEEEEEEEDEEELSQGFLDLTEMLLDSHVGFPAKTIDETLETKTTATTDKRFNCI